MTIRTERTNRTDRNNGRDSTNGESMGEYKKGEGVWESMDGGIIGEFLAVREVGLSMGKI